LIVIKFLIFLLILGTCLPDEPEKRGFEERGRELQSQGEKMLRRIQKLTSPDLNWSPEPFDSEASSLDRENNGRIMLDPRTSLLHIERVGENDG
jgi:hypothetical protein